MNRPLDWLKTNQDFWSSENPWSHLSRREKPTSQNARIQILSVFYRTVRRRSLGVRTRGRTSLTSTEISTVVKPLSAVFRPRSLRLQSRGLEKHSRPHYQRVQSYAVVIIPRSGGQDTSCKDVTVGYLKPGCSGSRNIYHSNIILTIQYLLLSFSDD